MNISALVGGKVLTALSVNIVATSINTITTASSNIYNIFHSLNSYSCQDDKCLIDTIKTLDIELTIQIIDNMLLEINCEKYDSTTMQSIIVALKFIIKDIEEELVHFSNNLAYNNSLWVGKYWRSYDCSEHIKKITCYNNVLQNRFKLFTDLIKLDYVKKIKNEEIM